MRITVPLLATLAVATAAQAQVTTNDQALDSLKPAAPAQAPAAPAARPVHHSVRRTSTHPAARAAPPPAVPAAPPVNPVMIPPPPVLPVHPKPLPPPVPIKADAAGATSLIPGGVRLTFGPGTADLNPVNDQSLLNIAKLAQLDPALVITINAWAPGTPEDPSTPRRLSLDRALAARAVLINAGIPSDRYSRGTPIRSPFTPRAHAASKSGTATGALVESFGSCPAIDPSRIAPSRTVRENGPG